MNTKKIALSLATIGLAVLPIVALAQVGGSAPTGFATSLETLGQMIVNQIWIVFTIIAIIAFVIAGVLFLTSGGDPEKIAKARSALIWGVAGIVVGILAFTIIAVIRGALGA